MKSEFSLIMNGVKSVIPEITIFNGGEVNVRIPERKYPVSVSSVMINARVMDSDGVMALLLLVDAIRERFVDVDVNLSMGYVPYARQDRICNRGEAFSIGVFSKLINGCGFNNVFIADPHSDVTPALINNVRVIDQTSIIDGGILRDILIQSNILLVSPDAGASKKTEKLASHYRLEVVQGMKKRDLETGKLSGFEYYGDVNGRDVLIVDDICDGGGTFIGLGQKLLDGGARSVSLYVTHGIFSKGFQYLIDNGISHVYTTDSFKQAPHENLTIISTF